MQAADGLKELLVAVVLRLSRALHTIHKGSDLNELESRVHKAEINVIHIGRWGPGAHGVGSLRMVGVRMHWFTMVCEIVNQAAASLNEFAP